MSTGAMLWGGAAYNNGIVPFKNYMFGESFTRGGEPALLKSGSKEIGPDGKPMWGTYWVWDPRLTAQLILLFLYLGFMGLRASIDDVSRADRASAVLALVGVVNLPIIRYSVEWWNSIHQAPSVMKMDRPSMPFDMLAPLLAMLLGFSLYFGAVLLIRLRAEILRRERNASWIREELT